MLSETLSQLKKNVQGELEANILHIKQLETHHLHQLCKEGVSHRDIITHRLHRQLIKNSLYEKSVVSDFRSFLSSDTWFRKKIAHVNFSTLN